MASEQNPPPQMMETEPQTTSAPPPEQIRPYALYSPGHGQPFQPYQGQEPAMEALQNPPASVNKAWRITKLVFHGLVLVFCICGLGLGLSLVNIASYQFYVISACPVLAVAFLWSLAEFITQAVRKFKSGIHPGAHVGVSLILWMAIVVLGVIYGAFLAYLYSEFSCDDGYDGYDDNGYTYPSPYGYSCDGDGGDGSRSNLNVAIATAAFTGAVGLLYFALFIGACVDTHKRNAAAARPIVIVANPQQWGAMAQGGLRPMQETSNHDSSTARGNQPEQSHSVTEHYAPPGGSSQGQ